MIYEKKEHIGKYMHINSRNLKRNSMHGTAEMRPYENPWPYNVKTVFNKYLGNGRSN